MDRQIYQPTFCLNQPVEEIIPQAIGFNKEELIECVEQMCSFYDEIVYTDDNISELKANIAKLRKLDKTLNDERIRVVKVYMQPADSFKTQVDEVRAVISKRLDAALAIEKEFEDQRIAKKKELIQTIYESAIGDYASLVPLEKIFNTKWLNIGASEKAITAEIKKTVENIDNALVTIDALHSPFADRLKVYFFRTLDLGSAILENERLKEEQARIEAMNAKQLEKEAALEQPKVEQNSAETKAAGEQEQAERRFKVTLEFDITTTQAKALMEYITANSLTYKRLK